MTLSSNIVPILLLLLKMGKIGGRSSGIVVKFACSTLVAQGSQVWIPGVDLHTAYQAMLWQVSHIQNRGGLAQTLAHQSSSAKTGGLAADVSSELIFLKKKTLH